MVDYVDDFSFEKGAYWEIFGVDLTDVVGIHCSR